MKSIYLYVTDIAISLSANLHKLRKSSITIIILKDFQLVVLTAEGFGMIL